MPIPLRIPSVLLADILNSAAPRGPMHVFGDIVNSLGRYDHLFVEPLSLPAIAIALIWVFCGRLTL